MHQTTTSKQNKTRFPCHTERPEMAPEHRPINIRKHDRLHGCKLDCYHTHQTLSSQQFSNLTGFPNFLLLQGMEKSDFCGHQFGVQKPQQKPVSPQRASPVQEHVRTYMLAGRGEQLLAALQNHGNPAVCKTCRVPAETIETCTIFCPAAKNLPTKRPPFWGPFLDPKTGTKSPGHKQIKLRLNEWTPFWGPFLDPKTGVVLSAKLLSPSEKKHKFRLFLHVRDRSFPYRWVSRALQRREYLFSTPCEHLCPRMFLNSSLREVLLPITLHTIRVKAFMNCAALVELAIPPSLRCTGSGVFLDCTVFNRLVKMPGRHKWRVYAEENAFAICPVRWPPWLHMIPDMGHTPGLG